VAGDIFFLQHHWSSSGGAVTYVIGFLADRAHDASTRELLADMAAGNVSLLNLSDPARGDLVDIIVDELPSHVAGLADTQLRETLSDTFHDLYRFAREQQAYNRDPTQETYFTIGPNPGQYFRLEDLERTISRHLNETDFVRVDVSDYDPQQRAMVRDYIAELANPRVLIVGDD
jgi:hypothetical protein